MVALRTLAILVLTLSFFTFVALFGRLPAVRNTPIGWLHRFIWIYIPAKLYRIDQILTRGAIGDHAARFGHHLLFESHPYVLIFYLSLITISASVFLPQAWPHLTAAQILPLPFVLTCPYFFTYLAARSAPGQIITKSNLEEQLSYYPYDHALFFPNRICRTCNQIKPARSKHCSICGVCVAKSDHHCAWVNNCLGRENYKWFLCLLASLSLLLVYGASLAFVILKPHAQPARSADSTNSFIQRGKTFFSRMGNAIAENPRIGAVGLIAFFTAPLAFSLLLYHIYLIWAGFTTNESGKWADLRDSMDESLVWIGKRMPNYSEKCNTWPAKSDQVVVTTRDGQMPTFDTYGRGQSPIRIVPNSWTRCRRLAEIENLYDLGFLENLQDVFKNPNVNFFRTTSSRNTYVH